VSDSRGAIERVCDKFGLVPAVPGVMHFFNLYVFSRLRRGEGVVFVLRFRPSPVGHFRRSFDYATDSGGRAAHPILRSPAHATPAPRVIELYSAVAG
jgi:hypothetical protein